MNSPPETAERIRALLEARSGGHFHVRIVTPAFSGLPLVRRHRLVQDSLSPLYGTAIHALSLDTPAPEDLV